MFGETGTLIFVLNIYQGTATDMLWNFWFWITLEVTLLKRCDIHTVFIVIFQKFLYICQKIGRNNANSYLVVGMIADILIMK